MTADGWTTALRQRLGPGRLLPLGGPRDGAWIVEAAVAPRLREAAAAVRGVRLGLLRIGTADPDAPGARAPSEPVVPAPPSALWPQPLRVEAEFAVRTDPAGRVTEPLPATAARLRAALADTSRALGLGVTEVDLRVTGLLDPGNAGSPEEAPSDGAPPAAATPAAPEAWPGPPEAAGDGEESRATQASGPEYTGDDSADDSADDGTSRVTAAVLAVPGVARLAGMPGGMGPAVRVEPGAASLPRRHLRVEIAVSPHAHPAEVAVAVREAAGASLPDHPTVAVVVTAVEQGP